MTASIALIDYTGEDLHNHIKQMKVNEEVIQVIPTNQPRQDPRTGFEHRDYLLIYKLINYCTN